MLVLRIRVSQNTMPTTRFLHDDYTMKELSQLVNEAIEYKEALSVVLHPKHLHDGEEDVFKFTPALYEVVSVTYPTPEDLEELM